MIWWLVLLLIIPAYFAQTAFHEGSHALVAKLQGLTLESFVIWPHRRNGKLYFGRVSWSYPTTSYVSTDKGVVLRAWAPFIFGIPLWGTMLAVILCISMPAWLLTAAVVMWTSTTIDLVRGLMQAYLDKDYVDINKGAKRLNLSKTNRRLIVTPISAALALTWAVVVLCILL